MVIYTGKKSFLFFNLFVNCLFRQFLDTQYADKILIVQMDFGEDSASANLLASARYMGHFLTYTNQY